MANAKLTCFESESTNIERSRILVQPIWIKWIKINEHIRLIHRNHHRYWNKLAVCDFHIAAVDKLETNIKSRKDPGKSLKFQLVSPSIAQMLRKSNGHLSNNLRQSDLKRNTNKSFSCFVIFSGGNRRLFLSLLLFIWSKVFQAQKMS